MAQDVSLITSAVSVDSDLRKCRITEREKWSSSCPVRVYLSGLHLKSNPRLNQEF